MLCCSYVTKDIATYKSDQKYIDWWLGSCSVAIVADAQKHNPHLRTYRSTALMCTCIVPALKNGAPKILCWRNVSRAYYAVRSRQGKTHLAAAGRRFIDGGWLLRNSWVAFFCTIFGPRYCDHRSESCALTTKPFKGSSLSSSMLGTMSRGACLSTRLIEFIRSDTTLATPYPSTTVLQPSYGWCDSTTIVYFRDNVAHGHPIIRSYFMTQILKDRHIPGVCDLAHGSGRELHSLHDLGQAAWVGPALYRDPAQHITTAG